MVTFKLGLSPADRERYGCDEWLDFDLLSVTAWEAALMQRGFTRDGVHVAFDTPNLWRRALIGEVVTGANDAPAVEPTVETEVGLDGETAPAPAVAAEIRPRRRPDFGAELLVVWLALRRAGIDVPMAEVDYDTGGMRWETVLDLPPAVEDEPVPGESEGKDGAGSPSGQPSTQTSPV